VGTADVEWNEVYPGIKSQLVKQFAVVQSLALQQTLYEMGKAMLEAYPEIAEVRLSAPNKHHFRYDVSRFGLANNNEVVHADDRPYGLIQATVTRDDAPTAGLPGIANSDGCPEVGLLNSTHSDCSQAPMRVGF
jgi:urate oxidase